MGSGRGKQQRVLARGGSEDMLAITGPPLILALPGDDRGFRFVRDRDRVLVVPEKGSKMRYADWTQEELPFRSLVLREGTGEVLSSGFEKFYNYGEGADDGSPCWQDQALIRAMEHEEPVYFTEKFDGSMCCRSVIDGEVVLRTRGSLAESEHVLAMRAVAEDKYPRLLDPSFAPGHSLLLEFVSPNFRIVLPYEDDDLVLVGAVDHHDLRQLDVPELAAVAVQNGLRMMDVVELPRDPDELVETVRILEGREGVVARCDGGQVMVKIKAHEYLMRHRLRFALSARVIRAVCEEHGVESLADFEEYLKGQGADWELVSGSRPIVETYVRASHQANEDYAALRAEVTAKLAEHPERRDFAVEYASKLRETDRPVAFALASGKPERAEELFRSYALDAAFDELEAADEAVEGKE